MLFPLITSRFLTYIPLLPSAPNMVVLRPVWCPCQLIIPDVSPNECEIYSLGSSSSYGPFSCVWATLELRWVHSYSRILGIYDTLTSDILLEMKVKSSSLVLHCRLLSFFSEKRKASAAFLESFHSSRWTEMFPKTLLCSSEKPVSINGSKSCNMINNAVHPAVSQLDFQKLF